MSIQSTEKIRGQVVKVSSVDNHAITVSGRLPRIVRVRDEPWDCITAPETFLDRLRRDRVRADVFTFMQELADPTPRYNYRLEWDSHAVVPVSTFDHWWKKQLDNKSRNMIRRAQKNGVDVRLVDFDDQLIAGIVEIYNESPVRQGKPFWHYGKDFETIKRDHATFLDRSQFIGAFLGTELIGFAKLVHSRNVVSLMQIISKIAQRDKAPTNALVAKAVEVCADAGIPHLHYGVWSKGGLGAFKTSHAFVRYDVPRYYIPLNATGRLALRANFHHKWSKALPQSWIDRLSLARQKWNLFRYRSKS